MLYRSLVAAAAFLLVSPQLSADSPYIPDALKPWQEWVLHGKEDQLCPQIASSGAKTCTWPTSIDLELTSKGGRFTQQWYLLAPGYITLPGDKSFSPLDVTLNGVRAYVDGNGSGDSRIFLKAGFHKISGNFIWDRLPASISIPSETAIVALQIDGKRVHYPKLTGASLFLKAADEQQVLSTDSIDLRVHRKVEDDIPLVLETQFDLTISGKNREITLSGYHPEGFSLMEITSVLPVRTNNKGELVIQVRPGKWMVQIRARANGPVTEIARPPVVAPMPEDEVWVFESREQLRLVNIEGVVTIDPSQTLLPDAWKVFPAYQVEQDAKFRLSEKKRGNPSPGPDRVVLARTVWLDFNGRGYTIKDNLSGEVKQSWRLEMNQPALLGKVTVNSENQLITRGESGDSGVELTQGKLQIDADSRINTATRKFSANGWNLDVQGLSVNLQLPPAWRVFHVAGADTTYGTWLKTWDLLHLFVLLVFTIAVGRLAGPIWGVLAFFAIALILPEGSDAPKYIWLAALPVLALAKMTIPKPFDKLFFVYKWTVGITLVCIGVLFCLEQVRTSMYPVLERPWISLGDDTDYATHEGGSAVSMMMNKEAAPEGKSDDDYDGEIADEMAAPQAPQALEDTMRGDVDIGSIVGNSDPKPKRAGGGGSYGEKDKKQMMNLVQYDPKANIQTGPGLPQWRWQAVTLGWNGPVKADQEVQFLLMPPFLNRSLGFVRAFLVLALVALILSGGRYQIGNLRFPQLPKVLAALIAALFFAGADRAEAAEYPSPEILNTLTTRLLEKPVCAPNCFSVGRLMINIQGDVLTMRLEALVSEDSVLPLPGDTNHWLPQEVLVGDSSIPLIRTNASTFHALVKKGVRQIVLRGKIPERDNIQISLPLIPTHTEFSGTGWTIDGIHENGKADSSISLQRIASGNAGTKSGEETSEDLAGTLPAFVRVERTISIGLDWLVTTKVVRLAGSGNAINLKLPLLAGEQVTSADIRVADKSVALTMGPNIDEVFYESTITPADTLVLNAAKNNLWTEWWFLEHSPIWHVDFDGIPVIDHVNDSGARRPHWRPWPGETVTLKITRPAAVEGATATVDRTVLEVVPGDRSSESTLTLTVRASIGSDLKITLPVDAEFQSVSIDGKDGIIQPVEGLITVPLKPGKQVIKAVWRLNDGMRLLFTTPKVDIGLPGVNYTLNVKMPEGHWTLWFMGNGTGPALLFWSRLFMVMLVGFALGRLPMSPLKSWQWMLLGTGLTQTDLLGTIVVVGFFLVMQWRAMKPEMKHPLLFNLRQLVIIGWGLVAIVVMLDALNTGFFGTPKMQVVGNGSNFRSLNWFLDRHESLLPSARVFSIPMLVYQIIMLAWALWLAFSVVKWSQWVWHAMGTGGWFQKVPPLGVRSAAKKAAETKASDTPPLD